MADLLGKVERAAPFAFPVLITGEAGSGKEVCARAIHEASPRAGKPWVPANCANLTPTLAASLLFGHRKGAFTGADRDHVGLRGGGARRHALPRRGGGGAARGPARPPQLPAGRLLHAPGRDPRTALRRAGGGGHEQGPGAAVAAGRFREDLFHRSASSPSRCRPSGSRPEDIPLLFDHFLPGRPRTRACPSPRWSRPSSRGWRPMRGPATSGSCRTWRGPAGGGPRRAPDPGGPPARPLDAGARRGRRASRPGGGGGAAAIESALKEAGG